MMRAWEQRYRWSVIVGIGVLIIALILWTRFAYPRAPAQLPAEGVLVWTVWSRVQEGIAAGLRGANVPNSRGCWAADLSRVPYQSARIAACHEQPLCQLTDAPQFIVVLCGKQVSLLEPKGRVVYQLGLRKGETLKTLSYRGRYMIVEDAQGNLIRRHWQPKDAEVSVFGKDTLLSVPSVRRNVVPTLNGSRLVWWDGASIVISDAHGKQVGEPLQGQLLGVNVGGEIFYYSVGALWCYSIQQSTCRQLARLVLDDDEVPVTVSPTGSYVATLRIRTDLLRMVPEIKHFRIRRTRDSAIVAELEMGWGKVSVVWLGKS